MRLSFVDNQSGFTLTELIVALALSALVLVLVVSGSLFVKKYIADWSDRDKLTEELAFVAQEILPKLESARRIELRGDSLWCVEPNGRTIRYSLEDGILLKDNHQLTRAGLRVDLFEITTNFLPNDSTIDTLRIAASPSGLYSFTVAVSDTRGNTDTLTVVGRNRHETYKFTQ